jgi:hypothetical protein
MADNFMAAILSLSRGSNRFCSTIEIEKKESGFLTPELAS